MENDIAFGPRSLGLSEQEIKERVQHTMELLNLDYEKFRNKSPFELSGGEKRKVQLQAYWLCSPNIWF